MKLIQSDFSNYYIMDSIEIKIYNAVKYWQPIPTGSGNKEIMNALTRLRRNGFIKNLGSRSHPRWVIARDNFAYKKEN